MLTPPVMMMSYNQFINQLEQVEVGTLVGRQGVSTNVHTRAFTSRHVVASICGIMKNNFSSPGVRSSRFAPMPFDAFCRRSSNLFCLTGQRCSGREGWDQLLIPLADGSILVKLVLANLIKTLGQYITSPRVLLQANFQSVFVGIVQISQNRLL